MAYNVLDIQTLINDKKVVDITQISLVNAYVSIGYWQRGQRKSSDGINAYPQYAINLQQLIAAAPGTPIIVKDEGGIVSANILSIDFVGAGVTVTPVSPTEVTVTIPGGGGGGGVSSVNANSGLVAIGAIGTPTIQLGTNPLLADTVIPTNTSGFNLSLTGTGKMGIGLIATPGISNAAKLQVMSNGGADFIAGVVSGSTLTLQTTWVIGGNTYISNPYTGTINIGDGLFCPTDGGIVPGTYITGNPSPGVYTLSTAGNSFTAYGTTTPALPPGTAGFNLSTSPLVLKLEALTGSTWDAGVSSTNRPALEVWANGAIKSGNIFISKQGSGGGKFSFGFPTSTNPFGTAGAGNGCMAVLGPISTNQYVSTGTVGNRSGIRFVAQNECAINGDSDLSIGYWSLNGQRGRHAFIGGIAVTKSWENGGNNINNRFPAIYYGADSSIAGNYGAQQGYSLCVYQPFLPTTAGSIGSSILGYISGNTLYVLGGVTPCSALPAGLMTNGNTLSGSSGAAAVLMDTTITATVVAYVPGTLAGVPPTCPGAATVGEYTLSGPPQTFGSLASPVTMYISGYPNWNNSRAMYVDGTIKFKNLPQGAGVVPAGLTAGDIWVDTSAGNVLKMV